MPLRKYTLVLALSLLLPSLMPGQIKMGQWRTHLPYRYAELVEATQGKIFCSTTGGLFTYNLEDNSIETLSKIDGFSDIGINAMRYGAESNTLVMVYQNSNIDIVRDALIYNIPDLMQKQLPGDKSVYDVYIYDENAYLSTGFGIVVLNLSKNEIRDTYYIGENGASLKVNQVSIDGTYIWAATDMGIRRAELSNPFLVDFNAWEMVEDLPDPTGAYSAIAALGDILFTAWEDPSGQQDIIYFTQGSAWSPYPYFTGKDCREMRSQGELLTLVEEKKVSLISQDLLVVGTEGTYDPRSAALHQDGSLWIADDGAGLITRMSGEQERIVPNGPQTNIVFEMATGGGNLYTVPGGIDGTWNNLFKTATLEFFRGEEWDHVTNEDSRDLTSVIVDPSDPDHVFAGSWGHGIHEFRDGVEVANYKVGNSTLQTIIPNGPYVRIGGLAYDPLGNLWMSNSDVEEPVSVLKADGTWKSFRVDGKLSEYNYLSRMLVTRAGHKWMIVPRGNGLFAMDDNGSIDNEADDTYEKISVVDRFGKVITNDIRSFAEDQNGNLWLGTNQGILVMYSPHRLFTDGFVYAQEIIVPREGEVNPDGTIPGDVLLGDQVVTTIEVDGANRKWLGTQGGGAYLVSEDGLEEIHHFTALNSPLLSDNVFDITIDGTTGEVYFATDNGIISYKGDALQGYDSYSEVVVYPNPVRETYYGPVAIKGLINDTNVKIQDMGGNLVFETQSLGGQAIWDGTNFRGERVATGVYLIFLSDPDGNFQHVTKLLFIH